MSKTKERIHDSNLRYKQGLGQNFIYDEDLLAALVASSEITKEDDVLEIGPGIGPLTQQLALRAGKVCAVEVDMRLKPILALTLADCGNVEILWEDVLKLDIPALVQEKLGGLRPMACANLPYYITSPILTALLEAECFEAVTVMVQKEVAQRIAAGPGTADYGAFSVFCQYYAQPELLFDVPPHCFLPQPKVTSAVVTLRVRQQRPWDIPDKGLFFRVVRSSFAMRRKKLSNGLASGFPELGKSGAEDVLRACGLPDNVRGETLGIPEFARIAREISHWRERA